MSDGLSKPLREQLIRLRRRPEEAPNSNARLRELHRAGLAIGRPLMRPSGKPSRYREWAITDRGLEVLEAAHG